MAVIFYLPAKLLIMDKGLMPYLVAIFLIFYGGRSWKAGIRNEDRAFWMSPDYENVKKESRRKYEKYRNIVLGIVSIIIGLILLILNKPK